MKTLEQLAREAGMADDSGYWLSIFVGKPSEVSLKALARFRAACRAEALEEAAQLRKVVEAHIADLRACIPTLQSHRLLATADEVQKACEELNAAIREMK